MTNAFALGPHARRAGAPPDVGLLGRDRAVVRARTEIARCRSGCEHTRLAHQPQRVLLRRAHALDPQTRAQRVRRPSPTNGVTPRSARICSVSSASVYSVFGPRLCCGPLITSSCERTQYTLDRDLSNKRITRRTPKHRFTEVDRSAITVSTSGMPKGSRSSCLRSSAFKHSLSIVSSPIYALRSRAPGPPVRMRRASSGRPGRRPGFHHATTTALTPSSREGASSSSPRRIRRTASLLRREENRHRSRLGSPPVGLRPPCGDSDCCFLADIDTACAHQSGRLWGVQRNREAGEYLRITISDGSLGSFAVRIRMPAWRSIARHSARHNFVTALRAGS